MGDESAISVIPAEKTAVDAALALSPSRKRDDSRPPLKRW